MRLRLLLNSIIVSLIVLIVLLFLATSGYSNSPGTMSIMNTDIISASSNMFSQYLTSGIGSNIGFGNMPSVQCFASLPSIIIKKYEDPDYEPPYIPVPNPNLQRPINDPFSPSFPLIFHGSTSSIGFGPSLLSSIGPFYGAELALASGYGLSGQLMNTWEPTFRAPVANPFDISGVVSDIVSPSPLWSSPSLMPLPLFSSLLPPDKLFGGN